PLCEDVAAGRGLPASVAWRPEAAVGLVLASGGDPGGDRAGAPVRGLARPGGPPGGTVVPSGAPRPGGRPLAARRGRPGRGAAGGGPRGAGPGRGHPERDRGCLCRGGRDPFRRRPLPARHRPSGPSTLGPRSVAPPLTRESAGAARRRCEPTATGGAREGGR